MVSITTLGRALEQIDRIKVQQEQFDVLSQQMATGKKTQRFAGLGSDDIVSLRGRAQVSQLQTYIDNIDRGDTRVNTMIRKIEEFESQAENFADALVEYTRNAAQQKGNIVTYDDPLTPGEVEETQVGYDSAEAVEDLKNLQDMADKLFTLMGDIINFQDGDRYVFAGASGNVKPYTDTGSLDAAVSNLINTWKAGGMNTDSLVADLSDGTTANGNNDAITDALIGYSSELSSGTAGEVFIRVDQSIQVEYTALANDSGFRDIMVALAAFKSEDLTPVNDVYTTSTFPAPPDINGAPGGTVQEQTENFFDLFQGITTMVVNAIDDLQSKKVSLEQARVQMNNFKGAHEEDKNLLQGTVDNVENIDINEVALQITTLQTNLQASFNVTALVRDLTLTNFL